MAQQDEKVHPGVPLRDYLAGQVLQALIPMTLQVQQPAIAGPDGQTAPGPADLNPNGIAWACRRSWNVADIMLDLRAQTLESHRARLAARVAPQNGHVPSRLELLEGEPPTEG